MILVRGLERRAGVKDLASLEVPPVSVIWNQNTCGMSTARSASFAVASALRVTGMRLRHFLAEKTRGVPVGRVNGTSGGRCVAGAAER